MIFLILCVCQWSFGQHTYSFGLLPGINVNKKLGNDWRINGKVETRLNLSEGAFAEGGETGFEYQLTDVSLILSRKVGLNNSLAGGYLIRLRRSGQISSRFIQQFTMVSKYNAFRLAHRLAADQTFSADDPVSLRARYRVAIDLALSGQSVDPKEFYFKLEHEYLGIFQGDDFELETRLVPTLGYALTDSNKLEWGLNYRLSPLFQNDPESNFWLAVNWYRSF